MMYICKIYSKFFSKNLLIYFQRKKKGQKFDNIDKMYILNKLTTH